MNQPYKRQFRTQQPVQPEPVRPVHRRRRRARRSLFATFLMIVGAATLIVLLMRYVIVPVLVMLPQWLGGAQG